MMINYYQSHEKNDTKVDRRYVDAMETRNRVASSLLSDVIGHLEKLATACQRLKAVLAVDLIEHTTSVPGQIHESINTIVQQTQDSLAEFSSEIVDKFADYYEQNKDYAVTQLVDSAKSLLSHHFYFENLDVNDTDSFNISRIEEIFYFADAMWKDIQDDRYGLFDAKETNFSTKLFIDRTCRTYFYRPEFWTNDTDYIEKSLEHYQRITDFARTVLQCGPMYRTFLSEVQSWLKSAITMNSSLPLQPMDHRYILVELEHELNWLNAISRTFTEESVVRSYTHIDYNTSRTRRMQLDL